jgi:hypothetical protein
MGRRINHATFREFALMEAFKEDEIKAVPPKLGQCRR